MPELASATAVPANAAGLPTIAPNTDSLGAEVASLDLSQPVSDAAFELIHEAFLRHKVLVFRGQPLEDEAHQAFAMRFGPLEGHINVSTRHAKLPQVQVFSNVKNDGTTTGVHPEKGTLVWHTDKSYVAEPSLTTILRSPAIAKKGGDTLFADMTRAYEDLPEETKQKLEGLLCVHDWKRSREKSHERAATEDEMRAAPPVVHPMVRTHPETGAKALYIGNHTSCIVGWDYATSDAFIAELEAHATQPKYIYRHKWQVNDVMMWDNRSTMHCIEPYDAATEKRAVHRVVVRGDRPY
ncbi:MAG: TauD/TfdA dioxygenase family protein [Alphaproteobacteria bacterium]